MNHLTLGLKLMMVLSFLIPAKALADNAKLSAHHNGSIKSAGVPSKKSMARAKKKRSKHRSASKTQRKFYQLTSGPGYRLQDPTHGWGTFTAVMTLQQSLTQYHDQYPEAPDLVIHDLSRRRGGKLHPHASHRSGRDVDIRLPLNPPQSRYVEARPSTLDVEHTWYLIAALLQTKTIEYIFIDIKLQRVLHRFAKTKGYKNQALGEIFQYPRGYRQGIIRHEPGHKGHMHVRFLHQQAKAQDLVL